ncbi:TlpA family protein disulfide reductase [Polaribacter sp.]|jgi:thiol-disulfide isomerase/thioredoxin|uniref:TlpA family protein disulfide reductase n=1 Tax=Polaribacter sp. TaxID=1920175 RepID=UPI004047BBC3
MKTTNKNLKLLITFFMFIITAASFCQDSIVIQGELKNNSRYAKVVVNKFGIGSFAIAAFPIENDKFSITAPVDILPGVYRLQYSQTANEYVDVIINGKEKNIAFSLDLFDEVEKRKPVFTQSKENQNWYSYQNQSQLQLQKIIALQQALAGYPNATDKIVAQLQTAVTQEQQNYHKQEATFLKNNGNTWAAHMVQNKAVYFTNPKDDWRLQDLAVRDHYWDNVDAGNPVLINSPLYTELILEYLKYYMNPEMNFSEEGMNEGFISSVDTIMQKFSANEETKKFAVQYLQLGFKELGNEKVLQHIDEKYQKLLAQCQDETDKTAFEKRMAGYAAMKEGMQAPNITFSDNGTLYDLPSGKTIVVFWASWCPNCMEEMPKVNAWAKENPNIKVVAISLDEDQAAYETTIQQFPNIFHHTDLKKWEGKAVNDYFVYGTPTFIVLDKDKKIVGKFASFEGVEKAK